MFLYLTHSIPVCLLRIHFPLWLPGFFRPNRNTLLMHRLRSSVAQIWKQFFSLDPWRVKMSLSSSSSSSSPVWLNNLDIFLKSLSNFSLVEPVKVGGYILPWLDKRFLYVPRGGARRIPDPSRDYLPTVGRKVVALILLMVQKSCTTWDVSQALSIMGETTKPNWLAGFQPSCIVQKWITSWILVAQAGGTSHLLQ